MALSSASRVHDGPESHVDKARAAAASREAANSPAAQALRDTSISASIATPAELEHQAERELCAEATRLALTSILLHGQELAFSYPGINYLV